jgi:hypothetical protein
MWAAQRVERQDEFDGAALIWSDALNPVAVALKSASSDELPERKAGH